ncbi:MAG TPA: cytochrome c oxidase assembly protein [Solirubrobacteraceae bacterium]|jgi:cytochrome c oxidase assembly factor CtaG|nr:cytochrome c oxidase assembly protein [Solirubrobacteraceae bacterium]
MSTATPTLARMLSSWQLDPAVLVVCAATAGLYGWGVIRSPKHWPLWQTVSFIAGLLVLMTALESGIDRYSDELLSVHVVQHLLLILAAPALLLWGAPVRLALSACSPAGRNMVGAVLHQRWVRVLTRPACGFVLFTIVVLGTHLSGLYEVALRDQTVHAFEHAAYFWSGIIFLLPILAADPVPRPPSAIAKFCWLMAAMSVMFIPAALFMFDEHVRYPFYLAPARALHRSALSDQHAAGMVMLFAGGVAMAALAIVVAMESMILEERRQQRRDQYLYADGEEPHNPPASVAGETVGA